MDNIEQLIVEWDKELTAHTLLLALFKERLHKAETKILELESRFDEIKHKMKLIKNI